MVTVLQLWNMSISFVLIHLVFFSIALNSVYVLIISYSLCSWWDLCVCECGTTNTKGYTPLYLAYLHGHVDVMKVLLENKASIRKYTEFSAIEKKTK